MYRVSTDAEVLEQIGALPDTALAAYVQVLAVLELVPWNGDPYHADNPAGAVRQLVFGSEGQGLVTYLIVEDLRRVDVLRVTWVE